VRRPGILRYISALFWFTLGLLSKPMLVTLPFLLVLLDVWPLRRITGWAQPADAGPAMSWGQILGEKIPFAILAIGSSAVTFLVQQRGGAVASLDAMPFGVRVANALTAYLAYIQQAIWPTKLAAWYPYPFSPALGTTVTACAVLAVVTIVTLRVARSRPYLLVGWLWFLGMLVPVIGFVQIGAQARADRYTYLPLIGLFLATVWGLAALAERWALPRRAVAVVAVVVVIVCASATRIQAGYWRDGVALWQRAVAVTTANGRAHTNLGTSLAGAGRQTEAVAEYRAALEIEPNLPQAHYNLGLALVSLGNLDEAIRHFREAVRVMPDYVQARDSLANALMDQQRIDEAIVQYKEALARQPGNAQIHNNLGTALAGLDRMPEATKEFLEAVRLEPDRADWQYAVGMAYAAQGDNAHAIPYLREAVRLDPRHDRARRLLAELGGGS
jgi:tetratricopeptide (TPR) repeat protein